MLALVCGEASIRGRLRASGYFALGDSISESDIARSSIFGVWKYKNGATSSLVEIHPIVVESSIGGNLICQQRAYEPTNEPGVCPQCPVRVDLEAKGKDCLFASKFFPRTTS